MQGTKRRRRADIRGEVLTWLSDGALALNLLLAIGLLVLIATEGLAHFQQRRIVRFDLADGRSVMGEVASREAAGRESGKARVRVKLGNRDLYGADFEWIDEAVRDLHGEDAAIARLAIVLAKASYRITDKMVAEVMGESRDEERFIRILAWSSFTAARRFAALVAEQVQKTDSGQTRAIAA